VADRKLKQRQRLLKMAPSVKWKGDGPVVLRALINALVRFVYKSLA